MAMKEETLIRKLGEAYYKKWQEHIANEVYTAREAILKCFKELGTSLPGGFFALELVKMELMRGQLEQLLGHVKKPTSISAKAKSKSQEKEVSAEPQ